MTLANLNFSAEVAAIMGRLGVPGRQPFRRHARPYARRSTARRSPPLPRSAPPTRRLRSKPPIEAFLEWRLVPAPKRGELIRLLGEELRAAKDDLGRLVSIEVGKITSEGLGEVQEMIDICDFAVGLSRQLYGLTIATERSEHRMMETWHPLGVTGIISAFNFPVAVWSWNSALALVCGNSTIWKPSEKTPLTAIATQAIFEKAVKPLRRRWRQGAGQSLDSADRRP